MAVQRTKQACLIFGVWLLAVAIPVPLLAESPQSNATEPKQPVSVDAMAFEIAKSLGSCMLNFKARHRAERNDPLIAAELARQENVECKMEERQSALVERLRIAYPEMIKEQLANERKNVIVLAMFAALSERRMTEKTQNGVTSNPPPKDRPQ